MNKKFLNNLPTSSGVYKMLDKEKNIIYIGKANNLKKRVSSYFSKSSHSLKNKRLISVIDDIDYQITSNEQDALLLENNLIKEYKPKYNILLRDDKSYPFIFSNSDHDFPSFKFYRGKLPKNGHAFGPYTHVYNVRKILSIIQKTFLVRLCEDSYFKSRTKPCLQYQIKRCSAPCVGYIDKKDYKASVDSSVLLLKGETKTLFNKLEKDMIRASNSKNYELAAKHRDNIGVLRDITNHYSVFPEDRSIDFIVFIRTESKILVDICMIRNGVNMGTKNYTFKFLEDDNSDEMLTSFFKQYYLMHIPPNVIISKERILDKNNIEAVINKKFNQSSKILNRIDKKYKDFFNICYQNIQNRALKISSESANPLKNLNKQLKLKTELILCFDVSHVSGSSTVGSAVYYDDQGFDKSYYRRYNISNTKKSDDYGALKEIIRRRLIKIENYIEKDILIIVDGGKGQITQAKKVTSSLNCKNTFIIGIHKGYNRLSRNDKVLDSSNKNITHDINEKSITLIQSIRDEAHRFAIMNSRKRHNKLLFNSKLDGIPGVGEARKKIIINHFGGIQGVLKASIKELESITGINNKLAETIYYNIHK